MAYTAKTKTPATAADDTLREAAIWDRFCGLYDADWTCWEVGDYAIVRDGVTTTWHLMEDITDEAMDEAIDEDGSVDYDRLCEMISALRDEQIPADVLAEGRRQLDLDDDEPVARGW